MGVIGILKSLLEMRSIIADEKLQWRKLFMNGGKNLSWRSYHSLRIQRKNPKMINMVTEILSMV